MTDYTNKGNREITIEEMSVDEIVDDMQHNTFLSKIDKSTIRDYAQYVSNKYQHETFKPPKEIFMPILNQIREQTKIKGLTDSSLQVLMGRYLTKDNYGLPTELPEEMFARVADVIAEADRSYGLNDEQIKKTTEEFYDLMASKKFMPNSPTIMNAGRELGQLSGCFVLPIEDSMEEIMENYKKAALIHKTGGGTGFSFSRLRPKNDYVKTTGGIASGPVSFMRVFNTVTDVVKQGGTRRGANMGILRYDHPDVIEFIHAKDEEGKFENFNFSVGITEEFIENAQKGEEYNLINPRTRKIAGKLNAKKVLDDIIESAWRKGDPGIIFLDRLNRSNPTPEIGEIESTNPCGEQPLLPYESCNLGSINLAEVVNDGKINWGELGRIVEVAVHFLDNVIDVNKYPYPQIKELTTANRKIGLGVMGFADMLILLGIRYDSLEAVRNAENVMSFIQTKAKKASANLAEKKGSFSNIEKSIYKGRLMRNATVTTIAPTGTISIIAGASSGIEPIFEVAQERKTSQFELTEVSQSFVRIANERGFYSDDLIRKIIENHGKVDGISEIPEDIRKLFVTAHETPLEQHLQIQSAFQRGTDNAVSKTINLANEATIEDVGKAYILAYSLGNIKGVTIYRDKSRTTQVLTGTAKNKLLEDKVVDSQITFPKIIRVKVEKPRAIDVRHAKKYRIATASGNLHITISDELYKVDNEKALWLPSEMFSNIKPIGSELSAVAAIGGLKNSYIFQGEDPDYIPLIQNLKSVKTGQKIGLGENAVFSLPHAEGLTLEYHLLTNGIIGYNEHGQLEQLFKKKNLNKIEEFDPMDVEHKTYEIITSSTNHEAAETPPAQNKTDNERENQVIRMKATSNIERGEEICSSCGSTRFRPQEGCHGGICLDCGETTCG